MKKGFIARFPIGDDYLTYREMEVLRLLAAGYQNKEMADRLHISIKTIEKHRQSVYLTLRVDSPLASARVAIRSGLLSIEEWLASKAGENIERIGFVSGQQIKEASPLQVCGE